MKPYQRIFSIAIPAMAGFIGLILFDIIDIYWIEKLGKHSVAGVASAGFIVWALYALIQVTSSGMASLVAQFYGAGKRRRAWAVINQATWLSLIISLFICLFFLLNLEKPFAWMGLDPYTAELAQKYFFIIIMGFPLIFLDMLAGNIFNAYGDNKVSNLIMFLCLIVNIILDPIMMFGWGPVPAMAISGAAAATIISHLLSLVARVYFLRKKNFIPGFTYFFKFRTFYFKKILSIGIPNALTGVIWSVVYPFLTRLITPFGVAPLSAIGIAHRLESVPYFSSVAFGIAMTSLVGQSVGRKNAEEADQVINAGVKVATLLLLPFALIFLIFPDKIFSFMTSDPELLMHGAEYLFIIGVFELMMGWEMVFGGIFTGLGVTYPTLFITIPFTVGRIPLAWFLAYYMGFGVSGIWWAISISSLCKGVGLALLYLAMKKKLLGPEFLRNRKKVAIASA